MIVERMLTIFQIKHEPSNYWGFSTQSRKPEEVSPEKTETPPMSIIDPTKTTDDQRGDGIHPPSEPTRSRNSNQPDTDSWIYKTTSRWLKDMLNRSEPCSSNLTQLPDKTSGRRNTVSFPEITRHGNQEGRSTARALTRHSVDSRYRSTFNDLEDILHSAVQLAKEAVEHFEYPSTRESDRGSVHESHRQVSESAYDDLPNSQVGSDR
jgi:hypothetical protein